MLPAAIIFDFDGVIADTELISMRVLADLLAKLGLPAERAAVESIFLGRKWAEAVGIYETRYLAQLPADLRQVWRAGIIDWTGPILPVPGVKEFIAGISDMPFCIASSSAKEWIDPLLAQFGLAGTFANRIVSGEDVTRGKPDPQAYTLAARLLEIDPSRIVVIEDSALGVNAAIAAGMTAVGMAAGSHMTNRSAAGLRAAGAAHVYSSYKSLLSRLGRLL